MKDHLSPNNFFDFLKKKRKKKYVNDNEEKKRVERKKYPGLVSICPAILSFSAWPCILHLSSLQGLISFWLAGQLEPTINRSAIIYSSSVNQRE